MGIYRCMKRIIEYDNFLNEEDYKSKLWKMAGSAFNQMLSGEPVTKNVGDQKDTETAADGSSKSTVARTPISSATPNDPNFTNVDLNNAKGFEAYEKICQKFIDKRPPNLLKITGKMLADSAKKAFNDGLPGTKIGAKGRYIPPELACAQLALEGGIGNKDSSSRPIRTKNPFNVGNTDSGANIYNDNVQKGIDTYYSLIARKYLVPPKKPSDLLKKFTNVNGSYYASSTGKYEDLLSKLAKEINTVAQPVLASLGVKQSNIA